MPFGEKLQKLRAREGLSQDALSELLNVSRQAVSRWERDGTMPETEKVIRISGCFHVTTDYLLKGGPERFPHPPVPCRTQARYGIRMASCWGCLFLLSASPVPDPGSPSGLSPAPEAPGRKAEITRYPLRPGGCPPGR